MRVLSVNPNIYGNSNRQQNKQIQMKQNPAVVYDKVGAAARRNLVIYIDNMDDEINYFGKSIKVCIEEIKEKIKNEKDPKTLKLLNQALDGLKERVHD